MSKELFKDLEKYLAQIQNFIGNNNQEMSDVFILARKTKDRDKFIIEFNKETIGLLILMITEDDTLSTLAQFALIHRMALESEEEIDAQFDKLKELSKNLRRELRGKKPLQIKVRKNNPNVS